MILAPIIVFAYNRPDHLRRTLDALAKNDLASQSVLYVFCDGPRDWAGKENFSLPLREGEGVGSYISRRYGVMHCSREEYDAYLQRIAEVRKVAHNQSGFKEVHVVEREKNIGLADNIVGAVTEIVNRYGRVIVFEDDMLTSTGTLQYFNDALETYKDDEKVMHVVSYMFPHRWPLPETFFYTVPYPGGGWATWARAWRYYPNDINELYYFWKDKWSYFNYWDHNGNDLVRQLEDNYNGTLRTWFIRWYAVMLKMGGLTLYPGKSLVTNIGFDGTGDNCVKLERNPYWIEHLASSISVKKVKYIKENCIGAHEIYAFHAGRWYNRRRRNRMLEKIRSFFHKFIHNI